jgi:hypothetical protein
MIIPPRGLGDITGNYEDADALAFARQAMGRDHPIHLLAARISFDQSVAMKLFLFLPSVSCRSLFS